MAEYTFAQLEGLWEQAGGSHTLAPVMAAIALAESGGPGATRADSNATGKAGEKGLWQINPHAWGSLATYDPLGNARAAVHVEKVQGLTAWTTFSNGDYKSHLGSAKPVLPKGSTGTGQAPGTTTAGGRGSGTGTVPVPDQAQINAATAKAVGAITDIGQTSSGTSFWDRFVKAVQALDPLASIPAAIVELSLPFAKFAQGLDWFFVPSHWIRIFAGLGGIVIGSAGVYELAHTGQDKPAALPMGIALTGGGMVLLFVAFHNVDPSIKTVGELASDLQFKVQNPGSTSPAAAVTAAGG